MILALLLAAIAPDCGLVPGFQQKGPARSYLADNLFDYINGNAEGYLIYQFKQMRGVSCEGGGVSLVVDVSEMADPDSAYGIFASNRDAGKPTENIGMIGQVLPQKAILAKDKYYAEVSASPSRDHTELLRKWAAALAAAIPGRTSLPEALGWFPTAGLQAGSIRMVPESVLGLRLFKRGWVAQYQGAKVFLVLEATPESAAGVMGKVKARIGQTEPAKLAEDAFQATDRYLGRMLVFRKGRFLGGCANLAEGVDGAALAAQLAARIP